MDKHQTLRLWQAPCSKELCYETMTSQDLATTVDSRFPSRSFSIIVTSQQAGKTNIAKDIHNATPSTESNSCISTGDNSMKDNGRWEDIGTE